MSMPRPPTAESLSRAHCQRSREATRNWNCARARSDTDRTARAKARSRESREASGVSATRSHPTGRDTDPDPTRERRPTRSSPLPYLRCALTGHRARCPVGSARACRTGPQAAARPAPSVLRSGLSVLRSAARNQPEATHIYIRASHPIHPVSLFRSMRRCRAFISVVFMFLFISVIVPLPSRNATNTKRGIRL